MMKDTVKWVHPEPGKVGGREMWLWGVWRIQKVNTKPIPSYDIFMQGIYIKGYIDLDYAKQRCLHLTRLCAESLEADSEET